MTENAATLAGFYEGILSACLNEELPGRWVAILSDTDIDTESGMPREGQGSKEANSFGKPADAAVLLQWPTGQAFKASITSVDLRESKLTFEKLRNSACRIGISTSGTTGRPKLIWHSPKSLTRTVKVSPAFANDRWGFGYAPTSFAGLQVFLQALANRNYLRFLPPESPGHQLETIITDQLNRISGTPSFLRLLTAASGIAPDVQTVTLGGEGADQTLLNRIRSTFPNAKIKNVYASTEAGSLFASSGSSFIVPIQLRDQVKILNTGDNNVGELAIHRDLLAESLRGLDVNAGDDFFATGDLVEVIADSPLEFRFHSRIGDWINVGGTKVDPIKIERVLTEQGEIVDARVFSKPNSVLGSIVCAQIVGSANGQVNIATLKQQLLAKLSRYEVPQIIEVVERLELNPTGKKTRR